MYVISVDIEVLYRDLDILDKFKDVSNVEIGSNMKQIEQNKRIELTKIENNLSTALELNTSENKEELIEENTSTTTEVKDETETELKVLLYRIKQVNGSNKKKDITNKWLVSEDEPEKKSTKCS